MTHRINTLLPVPRVTSGRMCDDFKHEIVFFYNILYTGQKPVFSH